MALTQEQFNRLKANLAFNKSDISVDLTDNSQGALSSIGSNIKQQFLAGGEKALESFKTTQQAAKAGSATGLLRGALGMASGGIQTVTSPITGVAQEVAETKPVSSVLKAYNENVTVPVADVLSNSPTLQKLAIKNPNIEEIISDAINVFGTLYAPRAARGTGTALESVVKKTGGAVSEVVKPITEVAAKPVTKTIDAIDDLVTKVTAPDISDATRLSLNPVASKELAPEFKVSVGGKLKPISEITPTENSKLKVSTEKSLNFFQKQAEKFKNERNPLNDPTEIVGQRIDKALAFADKKRQSIGKKMGDIEQKYADSRLPLSEKTTNNFIETLKDFDNPRFGADAGDAVVVRKLVSDFDNISKAGAKVGDRLEFIRAWERYLKDAKDGFGNFKENATVNTRIQNAIVALKNETVDAITRTDKTYRKLRNQYRLFKELDETGNRLLGKEGMLGDRIKGGATVKRAIKSNSDAGSRQFLIKLKEITGYDALKDGDIALTAMDLVGDYQGLSLLEVLSEGRGGILRKGLEKAQDVVAGGKEKRIRKFIKK